MSTSFVESKSLAQEGGAHPPLREHELNIQVKLTDMLPKLEALATKTASEVALQTTLPSAIASALKETFQNTQGGIWHCIVGQNFGSNVIHESNSLIFFTIGHLSVLLFKSGISPQ